MCPTSVRGEDCCKYCVEYADSQLSVGFDRQPKHLRQTPAARAAGLARGALMFREKLQRGLIEPDGTKEGVFCMDSYRWMFDCCRVPGSQGLDWSVSYTGKRDEDQHIVVIRRNRMYKVNVVEKGRILSIDEIEWQIQSIYDQTTQDYPGIGVLSASNRDVWAKDFLELLKHPENDKIIRDIHSSAFIISLDTDKPLDLVDFSRSVWHGAVKAGVPTGLRNRWVDKPLQFVVFDNAEAGFMGEHSVMDGTPTVRMCDEVLDILHDPAADLGMAPAGVTKGSRSPEPLDWHVSETTKDAIAKADRAATDLINTQAMAVYRTPYGKTAIKKFGVSPDSWAQMIIHLAYFRLLGGEPRKGGTYESATTRKFFKGRTEVIRVVSSEADAWAKSMDNSNASPAERKRLFDAAGKVHIARAKAAGNGQGVDRHMLGLKLLLDKSETVPEVFSDPVVARASKWVLSTSAVFSKHFEAYGWGEVVPEGFGVAYMTGFDDRLQFTIASRKEIPNKEFSQQIAKAADDLYVLHESLQKAKL